MSSHGLHNAQTALPRNMYSLERLNCLIVDGNRHMRTLLKGVLRAFGIRNVRESVDGAAALNELNLTATDLVVSEYALETLDGIDLTKLLRTASDSPNPLIPVIMLTGHTERHIVSRARDVGVNEFLAKPISAEALYGRIVSTIFFPRPFVHTKVFMGPDRRRHLMKSFKGGNRREAQTEFVWPRIWDLSYVPAAGKEERVS